MNLNKNHGISMKKIAMSLVLGACSAWAALTPSEIKNEVATMQNRLDSLEEFAASTTLGKDATPVSVSGNAYTRLRNFHYSDPSYLLANDKARTDLDAALNVALGVYPNSYVNLWTILTLPFDFSGYFANGAAYTESGMERTPYHHHIDYYGSSIWEEMTAGIDFRSNYLGAMLKAGGVLWLNSSPLTVWDRDPAPRFVSVYETFEEERIVGRYYKEKTFRPVKEGGRAFWTNRPFGGVMLDAYKLPFGMKGHLLLAEPKDADQNTRDGLRLYAGQPADAEMQGDLDQRGDIYQARLAKEKVFSEMTLGVNYLGLRMDKEIIWEGEFLSYFGSDDVPFFMNVDVASIDLKGNLNEKLSLLMDVAVARDDSIKYKEVNGSYNAKSYAHAEGDPQVALYAQMQTKHWEPLTLEAIYVPKYFYSPYALTTDSRNLSWRRQEMYMNAGTFRYSHNLTGMNFKFEPEFNRGRFDVLYGLHRQVEEAPDVVVFEHRLNGRTEWESLHSWSKYNSTLSIDQGSISGASNGEDQYLGRVSLANYGPSQRHYAQRGGLRGGTWETWEEFVPWASAEDIAEGNIPTHAKWSSSLTVNMAYDIAHWFNYSRNMQLAAYMTLSGISMDFSPLAYTDKYDDGMLLWSYFLQSEPAVAITDKFHFIGIFGLEMWRAEQAYTSLAEAELSGAGKTDGDVAMLEQEYLEHAPINYLQTAMGFGFDWDFVSRAGLHFRYKWATHTDQVVSENNWAGHIVTAETKVWF
jgi:hypothetical protein